MTLRVALGFLCLLLGFAPATPAQTSKDPKFAKIDNQLDRLHSEYSRYLLEARSTAFSPGSRIVRVADDLVLIDAAGGPSLFDELQTLGLRNAIRFKHVVSGQLPIAAIPELVQLQALRFARAATATTFTGATVSQGVEAITADVARAAFGVDGSDITVGTLSDSFDCLGGAASDSDSGDLPAAVALLQESTDCANARDEGRAMMQIISDIAPAASQAFHSANNGQAGFAQGIIDLATIAGARVIVDDVNYFAEPFFQDGIIAQAVDQVAAMGTVYFSAAGNNERRSYENAFNPGADFAEGDFPSAPGVATFFGGTAHDFGDGDYFQRLTVSADTSIVLSLQWQAPYFSASGGAGASNDLDIYLFDDPPVNVLAASTSGNIGADPIEVIELAEFNETRNVNVMIVRVAGPAPGRIKYVAFNDLTIAEFDTASGTIIGHANAAGSQAVAAAAYFETPLFGSDPPLLEPFSSAGGSAILYDLEDNPINQIRDKPGITCADGGNTTFFGGASSDGDAFPNFFGTSAAAPHAAGIAALMFNIAPRATPEQIHGILERTALDMAGADFDHDSGYGFCQAHAALHTLAQSVPSLSLLATLLLSLLVAATGGLVLKRRHRLILSRGYTR